jgi:hypothetical protein
MFFFFNLKVENNLNDTEFENAIKLFGKLDWLPTIPPASVEVLQQITVSLK